MGTALTSHPYSRLGKIPACLIHLNPSRRASSSSYSSSYSRPDCKRTDPTQILYLSPGFLVCKFQSQQPNKPTVSTIYYGRRKESIIRYVQLCGLFAYTDYNKSAHLVRLGSSGLKVSQIILGCMSYGSPEFQEWLLPEEESIKHIKAA